MTDQREPNRLQGLYLLQMGWAPRPAVSLAYQMLAANPGCDLCDLLIYNGVINEQAALQTRQAVRDHLSVPAASMGARSGSFIATAPVAASASSGPDSVASTPGRIESGAVIDGYELAEEIARGGMGVVFRARDRREGQLVALKFTLADSSEAIGVEEAARFKREVKALSRLRHPHIARLYSSGTHQGLLYYAMELLEGPSLHELIQETRRERRAEDFPWQRSVKYLGGIAAALASCHAQGLVHRDVKPHNIVIDAETDRAVLIDFGIVKRDRRLAQISSSSAALTQTGQLIGSPAFMSPEQFGAVEGQVVGPHSDVWSFGVTLFFSLTGVRPFTGPDLLALCQAVVSAPMPRVRDHVAAPDWLDELCAACLERNPYKRPEMAAVAAELAERSRPRSKLPALLAAVLAILGLAAALRPAEAPRVLGLEKLEELVNARSVTIAGLTNTPGSRVAVRRVEQREPLLILSCDDDGRFNGVVPLNEGVNSLLVAIEGQGEGPLLIITRDSRPPQIELPTPSAGRMSLILDTDRALRGRVSDAHLASLTINEQEQALRPDGAFTYIAPEEPEKGELEIVARDRLGTTTRRLLAYRLTPRQGFREHDQKTWEAMRRAWVYSSEAYIAVGQGFARARFVPARPNLESDPRLEALNDRERWRMASRRERSAILERVSARLGSSFERLDDGQEYSQADGSPPNTIASFRHRASGMVFQLIPGGVARVPYESVRPSVLRGCLTSAGETARSRELFRESLKFVSDYQIDLIRKGCQLGPEVSPWDIYQRTHDDPELLAKLRDAVRIAFQALSPTAPDSIGSVPIAPLLVGRYEVSEAEWATLTGQSGDDAPTDAPRTNLSYVQIRKALAGRRDGLRLPWRVEWIYACTGGLEDASLPRLLEPGRCVYRDGETRRPRSRRPSRLANGFGLVDMLGNAEEWCRPLWKDYRSRSEFYPAALGGDCFMFSELCAPRLFFYAPTNAASPRRGLRLVVDIPGE